MPNWKKLVTSGSAASLNSITVETFVSASSFIGDGSGLTGVTSYTNTDTLNFLNSINALSGSALQNAIDTEKARIDAILLTADADKDSFAEIVSLINSIDTDNDTAFASFYTASNGRLGALEAATSSLQAFTSSLESKTLISSSAQITGDLNVTSIQSPVITGSLLRLDENGTGLRMTNIGAFDNDNGSFRIFSNNDLILSTNGDSGTALTIDATSKDANFVGAVTASHFIGDGSGLTGIQSTVVQETTVVDSFSNKLTHSVPHNFGTKNVIVSVYTNTDQQIIPQTVTTTDDNTITVTFCESTSGRIVVAKGGHIVSGSIELYTHKEPISGSASYSITHNLNEDFPIIQIYDTLKKQVIPKEIQSVNLNTVQITFCETFTGMVVIKK